MIDLSHKLKVSDENIDLIEDIFQQEDTRYVDNNSAIVVTYFLENRGIKIENDNISEVYPSSENSSKNETVAVECGPCRTDKAIEYLRKENTVLWVISLSEKGSLDKEIPAFIIERGPNWDKCIMLYDQLLTEQLRKVRSPMDEL